MRLSGQCNALSFDGDVARGPYPPQGFVSIAEGALGNGDCFGLYWPLGREGDAPFVCEMFHDEGRMELRHSSVQVFSRWLELNEGEYGEHEVEDPGSPSERLEQARAQVLAAEVEQAIELLRAACTAFPELQQGWALLASQYMRQGQRDAAIDAARSAVLANWAFGIPEAGVLRILRAAPASTDPVIAVAQRMGFAFGGAKTNPDYALMQACIDECWAAGDTLTALRLSQNRCYVLAGETVSFQEREGFMLSRWQADFAGQCQAVLNDDRRGFSQD